MRYLFAFLRGIFKYLGLGLRGLGSIAKFLPLGFSFIFIVTNFFIDLASQGLKIASYNLAKTVFLAEIVINEKVSKAVYFPEVYGFFDFVAILVSLIILYNLAKFITKYVLVGIVGSQSPVSAFFFSIFIIGLISVVGSVVQNGSLGFIPIKDSIYYLFINIGPVLGFMGSLNPIQTTKNITNTTQNVTNTTLAYIGTLFRKKSI